jgi:GT2 family glycosyltransferase
MIDIAVVDWGTPQLAARCVGSLDSDHFTSIELVDAKRHGLSYSQAVNQSLAAGSAPYVLALNADTRMLEPPDHILALFEEHADIAVIGPRQVDQHGRITHAGIVGTNEDPKHRFWLQQLSEVDGLCREDQLDCVTVSGAVYFARRSAWEQLGGFLPTRLYYEETFLSYLARHRGYRVVYTGATTWEHRWNQSPADPGWRAATAAASQQAFRAACQKEGIACN